MIDLAPERPVNYYTPKQKFSFLVKDIGGGNKSLGQKPDAIPGIIFFKDITPNIIRNLPEKQEVKVAGKYLLEAGRLIRDTALKDLRKIVVDSDFADILKKATPLDSKLPKLKSQWIVQNDFILTSLLKAKIGKQIKNDIPFFPGKMSLDQIKTLNIEINRAQGAFCTGVTIALQDPNMVTEDKIKIIHELAEMMNQTEEINEEAHPSIMLNQKNPVIINEGDYKLNSQQVDFILAEYVKIIIDNKIVNEVTLRDLLIMIPNHSLNEDTIMKLYHIHNIYNNNDIFKNLGLLQKFSNRIHKEFR